MAEILNVIFISHRLSDVVLCCDTDKPFDIVVVGNGETKQRSVINAGAGFAYTVYKQGCSFNLSKAQRRAENIKNFIKCSSIYDVLYTYSYCRVYVV